MNLNRNTFQRLPKLNLDKKRFRIKHCPCGKSNKDGKFVPYVGYENKGYCHGCGETFLPELKRNDERWKFPAKQVKKPEFSYTIKKEPVKHLTASFIPVSTFKQSLKHHSKNNFIKYLLSIFGSEITGNLVGKYFIGTTKHWDGANVFWQIDIMGKIRTGKIMLYGALTGNRIKEPYNHTNWVHSVLKLPVFNLQQCFFGEHLLQGNNMAVAIVESEKTAIIASVYLPQFVWIAAGNKTGLTDEKCKVLQGRNVVLYPDLNAFDLWVKRTKELSHIANFTVSDLLEFKATEDEKKQGLDLADYLIRFPVSAFRTESEKHLINKINSNDIVSMLGETHTGPDFNKLIMAGIETKEGHVYDLLFDADGEIVRPGEHAETVNMLAAFFDKTLQYGLLDNIPCWVHTYG
jgi:hypothetical protein